MLFRRISAFIFIPLLSQRQEVTVWETDALYSTREMSDSQFFNLEMFKDERIAQLLFVLLEDLPASSQRSLEYWGKRGNTFRVLLFQWVNIHLVFDKEIIFLSMDWPVMSKLNVPL
jgi:hypothetical protein